MKMFDIRKADSHENVVKAVTPENEVLIIEI